MTRLYIVEEAKLETHIAHKFHAVVGEFHGGILAVVGQVGKADDLEVLEEELVGVIEQYWIVDELVVSRGIKLNELAVYRYVTEINDKHLILLLQVIPLGHEQDRSVQLQV